MTEFTTTEGFELSLLENTQRVVLLKRVDEVTESLFRKTILEKETNEELREKMERVVFQSNLAGIEEFSDEFMFLIKKKMERMTLYRGFITHALSTLGEGTGFTAFERELIIGSAKISQLYDPYYLKYLEVVQDPRILNQIAANPPATSDAACYSHYTVVDVNEAGEYITTSFAKAFENVLRPIIAEFDILISKLRALPNLTRENEADIAFLNHYRLCHASDTDPNTLEELWSELDRKWMDTKGWIQIVHDIETGYGDPLRMKATPDFSLRFLDESYSKENQIIREIQDHMMEYFQGRNTKISNDGLSALANTMAGIYYIPFKTGISLQFSFSGQSIPNRDDIKIEKGVKIYFDAVETEARVRLNLQYIHKVFADAAEVIAQYKPDAVEQLVWHVAAHEVGHAIYNLETMKEPLGNPSFLTLLEEPRAELTAMFTLKLLHEKGVLTLPHLTECLVHFALDALRYFAKYSSAPLQPYIIFQIYAYKVYHSSGYLSLDSQGKVVIDPSKTLEVLSVFSEKYLEILHAEDVLDGECLERIVEEMRSETDFITHVVSQVFTKK